MLADRCGTDAEMHLSCVFGVEKPLTSDYGTMHVGTSVIGVIYILVSKFCVNSFLTFMNEGGDKG